MAARKTPARARAQGHVPVTVDQEAAAHAMRTRARREICKHNYVAAVYWADKALALSRGAIADIYLVVQCYRHNNELDRCLEFLKRDGLIERSIVCRYVACSCALALDQLQEANELLLEDTALKHLELVPACAGDLDGYTLAGIRAHMCYMRGRVLDRQGLRKEAIPHLKQALMLDVTCYEALDLLMTAFMLSAAEERELFDALPFEAQCPTDHVMLKALYESRLTGFVLDQETLEKGQLVDPAPAQGAWSEEVERKDGSGMVDVKEVLAVIPDVLACCASTLYYGNQTERSLEVTRRVQQRDPLNRQSLAIHIACLVELGKNAELFGLAHRLVEIYPEEALAWYAVGCYYYLLSSNTSAQRYFHKVTQIDPTWSLGWVAVAHAFAREGEHDQAAAAYFTAARLLISCHIPLLYGCMDYIQTSNFVRAQRFFMRALSLAPGDPEVLNEYGVLAFKTGELDSAEGHFRAAVTNASQAREGDDSQTHDATAPEVLLAAHVNLAHTLRKLRRWDEAIDNYRTGIRMEPMEQRDSAIMTALAFTFHLKGDTDQAIGFYHEALALRHDDVFANHMLAVALKRASM